MTDPGTDGGGETHIRLLGPVEVVGPGHAVPLGRGKERVVFTLLAIHLNQVVAEDSLLDALWGDDAPRSAMKTARSYVSRLRQLLTDAGADLLVIERRAGGYRLSAPPDVVDVTRVESLVTQARRATADGDHAWAAVTLTEALRSWRGRPLGELAEQPWARAEAARLGELRLVVLEQHAEAELACGRHAALVPELEALCGAHPLRERFWGQRMLALYRAGRQAEALRAYQQLRRTLVDELGLEPSAELQGLEQAILEHDPGLAWSPPPAAAPPSPLPARGVDPPTGVVTFLFTDIEGSTGLWEAHADVMGDAMLQHDALIGEVVGRWRGRVIKSKGEGDSTLSVFSRPTDAATAAIAIQRAMQTEPWPAGVDMRVRIAVHTGEATVRDGDYYGVAVNRAARLRALAGGGQILCSGATAALIADRLPDGGGLVDLGSHELRGLSRPERVFALEHPDLPSVAPASAGAPPGPATALRPSVPAPLRLAQAGAFVDRESERGLLQRAWAGAVAGVRQAVLIGGEPGMGKTALVAEFATAVHGEGAVVLYGGSQEDLSVPYQAFAQALSDYVRTCPLAVLEPHVRRTGGDLARILPVLAARIPGAGQNGNGEGEAERYRLFEAATDLIAAAAAQSPVLLVLDDLQWAAAPTLLLLRHLLRTLGEARVLVCCLYRQTEVSAELGDALADLRGVPGVVRITLGGLDEPSVAALVEGTDLGRIDQSSAALARRLHAETGGSPYFVGELVRHIAETGTLDASTPLVELPASVTEVILRRLRRLCPPTQRLLATAAIVGPAFPVTVVERLLEPDDRPALLDSLDEAVAAGMLQELPTTHPEYTFTHALVRRVLYDQSSSVRRAALHVRVGEALEHLWGADIDRHLPMLAHHFLQGARMGAYDKAIDYAVGAGDQAFSQLAYEEAAGYYGRARDVIDAVGVPALRPRRIELLLASGDARRRAGDAVVARQTFAEAADEARRMRAPELLARAALGYGLGAGGLNRSVRSDPQLIALLEEALDHIGDGDPALRVRLLARLSEELYFTPQTERRMALAIDAVAIAERLDDPEVLAVALYCREVSRVGADVPIAERVHSCRELLALAEQLGDREAMYAAHLLHELALLESGDVAGGKAALDAATELAHEMKIPSLVAWTTAGWARRAWLAGACDEADRLNQQAMAEGLSQGGDPDVVLFVIGGQAMAQQILRADLEPFIPALQEFAGQYPNLLIVRAFLAYAYADSGRFAEATVEMETLSEAEFHLLRGSEPWLETAWAVARCCAVLHDAERSPALYRLLLPYEDRWLADWAGISLGPVATSLGMLAAVNGDAAAAARHFERALAIATSSPPWFADAAHQFATMLMATGRPDDRTRARQLAADAHALAAASGLHTLAERLAALRADRAS